MISLDNVIDAFAICRDKGCYLSEGFKLSKSAPDKKDETNVVFNLLSDVQKVVVREASLDKVEEKCAKISSLISPYVARFETVKNHPKIHSILKGLDPSHMNTIIATFEKCVGTASYIMPGYTISDTIPDAKDQIKDAITLITHIEKTILEQISIIETAEKCAKLSRLIPEYFKRFDVVTTDRVVKKKIDSLVCRLEFAHKLEQVGLKLIVDETDRISSKTALYKKHFKKDLSWNTTFSAILLMSTRSLSTYKHWLLEFKEIFDLFMVWKDRLIDEGIYTSSSGKVLVFPIIETKGVTEISLRLKAIAETKKILDLDVGFKDEFDSRFAAKIKNEIHVYKAQNPERAVFCDDLLKFLIINARLIKYQLIENRKILESLTGSEYGKLRYMSSVFDLALKDFLHTITDVFLNGVSIEYETVMNKYLEKYQTIEAEYISDEATAEGVGAFNDLIHHTNKLKQKVDTFGTRGADRSILKAHSILKGENPQADLEEYNQYIDILKSGKRVSPTIISLLACETAKSTSFIDSKESLDSFLPKELIVSSSQSRKTPQKRRNTKKNVQQIKKSTATSHSTSTDKELSAVSKKIEKLTIEAKPVVAKPKPVEKKLTTIVYRKLFPAPKMRLHERVLRWKRANALNIFNSDPSYSGIYSEQTKRRIVFEHGFADAVAAVAMKEGNITQSKADREKYGAFKRVQVVGEVLFGSTEERVQGVFSFSQGKDGVWFHVGFTRQENEASCKNFLKTGLYCVEYPTLIADTVDSVSTEVKTEVLKDGSFIENVSDSIVTIKDPAHDATIYLARVKT